MEQTTLSLENNPLLQEDPFKSECRTSRRYYVTGFISGGRLSKSTYSLRDIFKSPEAIACYREFEREFPRYKELVCS